ncbi:MAG: UDP-N-acetylglucosamine 1-carboxyvinyltransferase [Calditrichaceae bacterium]|nr:UDP-N-acetylglucosamine 1-carboxyvinyltransferase [Calditrichaceae bacterium]RQV92815.1 MAG: UDP-N-acetylglucosamine 1-carboxyvinyltransferase [Calditrichota bacterium]
MAKFIIKGGNPLRGEITVAGNKNAALPVIAATALTDQECLLENVPRIRDVLVMLEILESIGKEVHFTDKNTVTIRGHIKRSALQKSETGRLRASILYLGGLLMKTGEVYLPPPGGCVIGRRKLDSHFDVLESFGAEILTDDDGFKAVIKKPQPAALFLKEASVTATENAMLIDAAVPGKTIIENAAAEPHVTDLGYVLQKMGAKIDGLGTNRLLISGHKNLSGFHHRIMPDHIEAGTFAIAAACTGGDLLIKDAEKEHLKMTRFYLEQMGVSIKDIENNIIRVKPSMLISNIKKIQVGLWPGFPTDLMSPMIVLATQATGTTLCHDWMYESRMFFVDKLILMGANITQCDPHRVLVSGPTRLRGQELSSPDIRAGIALVIAAMTASGKSEINQVELVDRGYEDIDERFKAAGADIIRESDE